MNIPKISALYESSLASALSAAGSSFTVVSGTDRDGNALSGLYGFIIDEGTATEEFVIGTISGTTVTITYRGIDADAPNTEVTANKKAHRRGASVKITDYPIIGVLRNILNGDETIPNKLSYASHPSISSNTDIPDKQYVDALANTGAADATTTVQGLVELATQAEIEAGTGTGATGATLVMPNDKNGGKLYFGYAADAGANDTYVVTCSPVPTAYTTGMVIHFKANTANTGACTINVNTLGAKSLKVNKDLDPQDGYIKAGQDVEIIYDGTNFQILSVSGKPSVSQSGEEIYAASSAGSDTYAITVAPAPAAYVTGQVFRFKADVANTGTCTLNVNGLGAKTIYKGVDNALIDNDILANQIVEVIYDGTNFQMLSALSNGRFTAGSFTTRSGAAGNNDNVNNDETIAVGFRPRFIRVHYYLMGYSGGTGLRVLVGSALFSGTTLLANIPYLSKPDGSGDTNLVAASGANNSVATLFTTNTFSTKIDDTTALQAGDLGNNNGVKLLLTINSVSGTGFVIRINETSQSSATGNNYRFQGWYEVYS